MKEIQYNEGEEQAFVTKYRYTYNGAGQLRAITDCETGEVTQYEYNSAGKLIRSFVYDSTEGLALQADGLHFNSASYRTFWLRYYEVYPRLRKRENGEQS